MKKSLLFLLISTAAIHAMQPQMQQDRLRTAILKLDYEEVKHLLYSKNYDQSQVETALELSEGARALFVINDEVDIIKQLDQIINLLKAFRVFSARDAKK